MCIIGSVIFNTSVTLLQFVIILLVWPLVVIVVKVAGESSKRIRAVMVGTPQLLVRNGTVNVALTVMTCLFGNGHNGPIAWKPANGPQLAFAGAAIHWRGVKRSNLPDAGVRKVRARFGERRWSWAPPGVRDFYNLSGVIISSE